MSEDYMNERTRLLLFTEYILQDPDRIDHYTRVCNGDHHMFNGYPPPPLSLKAREGLEYISKFVIDNKILSLHEKYDLVKRLITFTNSVPDEVYDFDLYILLEVLDNLVILNRVINLNTNLLARGLDKPDHDLLSEIIDLVLDCVEKDKCYLLKSIYNMDPFLLHNQTNIALLRSVFIARSKVYEWKNFRDKVVKVLESRGENIAQRMTGLLED